MAATTAVLSCRLPIPEADVYRAAAAERGIPLQQFIRDAMDRELRTTSPTAAAAPSAA